MPDMGYLGGPETSVARWLNAGLIAGINRRPPYRTTNCISIFSLIWYLEKRKHSTGNWFEVRVRSIELPHRPYVGLSREPIIIISHKPRIYICGPIGLSASDSELRSHSHHIVFQTSPVSYLMLFAVAHSPTRARCAYRVSRHLQIDRPILCLLHYCYKLRWYH